MRVVDLADDFHLTTQEAVDLCRAAGIEADDGASELNDAQVQHWKTLAEQQRQWNEANAAEEAAARAEADARRDERQRQAGTISAPPGGARPDGPDPNDPGSFGPIPPAPWEIGADPTDRPDVAPLVRSGTPELGPGWGVGSADSRAQITPLAPAALAIAVLSFLFPFVTAFAAIGLAILAKQRIRKSRGALTGERLATAAEVIAGISVCVWLGLLGFALYQDYRADQLVGYSADLQVDTDEIEWNRIAVGQCVRVPHADIPVRSWQGVECGSPHEGEIISIHPVAKQDGNYPGRGTFIPLGEDLCKADFLTYVGVPYEQSTLNVAVVFPTVSNWIAEGDRRVACIVYNENYDYLTGTVKDLRR